MTRAFRVFVGALIALAAASTGAEVLESPPFRIEYTAGDAGIAERSMEVLQAALLDLRPKLPPGDETITVIICSSIEQFTGYAGPFMPGKVTGVAQSANGLIAVKAPYLAIKGAAEYEPTLRHELVHVLLARNGLTVNMPRWLNEGLAMTLGREHGWSASMRVAQMYLEGQILTPRQMHIAFATSGAEMEFGDAYAQSLSLTRYLRKHLGDDAFWALITSLDEQTFSDGLREYDIDGIQALWAEWQRSLWLFAIVFSVVSGFTLFQGAAVLTVWSYIRRKRKGEARMREWDREEALEAGPFDDDEYVEEGPYEWESYYDEEDDEFR